MQDKQTGNEAVLGLIEITPRAKFFLDAVQDIYGILHAIPESLFRGHPRLFSGLQRMARCLDPAEFGRHPEIGGAGFLDHLAPQGFKLLLGDFLITFGRRYPGAGGATTVERHLQIEEATRLSERGVTAPS